MLIKENEARDKASKSNNVADSAQPIIRHDMKKPKTPLLLKTVVQAVPKDSKCIKMLMGKHAIEGSPSKSENSKKIHGAQAAAAYAAARSSSVFTPPLTDEKMVGQKPRSQSTTVIEQPMTIYGSPLKTRMENKDDHSITSDQSKPFSKIFSGIDRQSPGVAKKTSEDSSMTLLKTIRSLLPSGDAYRKRLNSVHPSESTDDSAAEANDMAKPNNSEDSGISVDITKKNRNLLNQKSADNGNDSTGDSEDSSELSTVSSRRIIMADDNLAEVVQETTQEPDAANEESQDWISPSPSVFSLRALFRSNSSKSCDSISKGKSLTQQDGTNSVTATNNRQRSESMTSSSGYENLAFLPVDVLSSRRSSMFSDTSC